ARHDRADRVLVDKLGLPVTAQENAEIVEPGNDALQFDTIDQKYRNRHLGLADVIEKGVLQVLLIVGHLSFQYVSWVRALINIYASAARLASKLHPHPKQGFLFVISARIQA